MAAQNRWTREQLLIALFLYCQMPFGKIHRNNPEIILWAGRIGRTSNALAMKMLNLASLDPAITSTGRTGLKSVSLADRAIWEEANSDWGHFAEELAKALEQFSCTEMALEIERKDESPSGQIKETGADYSSIDRTASVSLRVGQNLFRNAVLSAYDNRCCISGLSHPKFLIASHIVPWRDDPQNRLNPHNGLCLSVLHDRAFDQGLLAIDDNMTVLVSPMLKHSPDAFLKETVLAYEGKTIELPEKFESDKAFLSHHQEHIFLSNGS